MLKTNIKETFLKLKKKKKTTQDLIWKSILCIWEFWPKMTNKCNKSTRLERKGKNAVDISAKRAGGL